MRRGNPARIAFSRHMSRKYSVSPPLFCISSSSLTSLLIFLVDLRFVALHHFVELTYNGLVRRLIVSSAKGSSSTPPASTPTGEQVFQISRSTHVNFKAPGSTSTAVKKRSPATKANGQVAAGSSVDGKGGDLPGYEMVGGMENQIEQIREMVEWPLTRPELYSHFGTFTSHSDLCRTKLNFRADQDFDHLAEFYCMVLLGQVKLCSHSRSHALLAQASSPSMDPLCLRLITARPKLD